MFSGEKSGGGGETKQLVSTTRGYLQAVMIRNRNAICKKQRRHRTGETTHWKQSEDAEDYIKKK